MAPHHRTTNWHRPFTRRSQILGNHQVVDPNSLGLTMTHSMNGKLDGWLSNTPPKRRIRIVDDDDDESGPPSTADARPHPQVIHISEEEDADQQLTPKESAGTQPVAQAHFPPPLCNAPVLIRLIRNESCAASPTRWFSRASTRHQQKDRSS